MVDGLNFKDFVAFLSTFSSKASLEQKIECENQLLIGGFLFSVLVWSILLAQSVIFSCPLVVFCFKT